MGEYTRKKYVYIRIMALAVMVLSVWFSAAGFGFEGSGGNLWLGWVFGAAVQAGEMLVNTNRRELNWTIFLVGVPSYAYSIFTNIYGYHEIRGATTGEVYTVMSVSFGLFVDIFPEVALSLTFGESTVGDIIGNVWYAIRNAARLAGLGEQRQYQQYQPRQYQQPQGQTPPPKYYREPK